MWICSSCEKHNQNRNDKCRRAFCNGGKPLEQLKEEQKQRDKVTIRDFCPKCQSHQDFKNITGKKFKCPKCKRSFKFRGKPVPEVKKVLVNNNVLVTMQT